MPTIDDFSKNYDAEIGLILGSGLGALAEEIEDSQAIDYKDIPGFPQTTVVGHKGRLVIGKMEGNKVVAMQGRFHFYEGHKLPLLAMPVRMMKKMGVSKLIVTNAAGSVNPDFLPGDFMLIKDHINFGFTNPLIGDNADEFGPRFPDNSVAYSEALINLAKKTAQSQGIAVREGNYFYMTGPSYETPAEIKMAQSLGGDAVGMSTFPEVLAATHCGIDVLGISLITNLGSGISEQPLSHSEVAEMAEKKKPQFVKLLRAIIRDC